MDGSTERRRRTWALAEAGQHEQAAAMASQAETAARSITDPEGQAQALTAVAGALAEAGQHEQADGGDLGAGRRRPSRAG